VFANYIIVLVESTVQCSGVLGKLFEIDTAKNFAIDRKNSEKVF
jgi:hypothetical protein